MTLYSILIVEDEAIAALYLKKQLEHAGYKIIDIVKEADTALNYFSNTSYKIDLVLMDIKIRKKMDGITLAKEIQKYSPSTAILFTTAYTDDDFFQRAKEVDAIGYLVKPLQSNTILSTIEIGMSQFLTTHNKKQTYLLCHNTYFNEDEQTIISPTKTVTLSHQEALLLKTLIKNTNHITTKQELEIIIEENKASSTGALRTILWRLRKKLPQCIAIETIYNLGYKVIYQ